MNPYQRRIIDDELDLLLPSLPAIAIDGPRAVGKTATAQQRAAKVHRLDTVPGAAIALASPDRLVTGPYPVLIDEWQRFPPSWDLVRRAVDDGGGPGRFLLTGSASPANLTIHSGAGRIASLRMRPMSLAERFPGVASVSLEALLRGDRPVIQGTTDTRLDEYVAEIVGSGFPGIRRLDDRGRRHALDAYIQQLANRDIEEAGQEVRRPTTLLRWMTAYAAATATTTSLSVIREAARGAGEGPPSKTTVLPYHDALQRLWFVDPVPAWQPTRNPFRRSTGAPKHHIADPALAARLLGAGANSLLEARDSAPSIPRDGTLLGSLFDSLVTLSVRTYAQRAEARVFHFRSKGGEREVDLILERDDHRVLAIEIKLSAAVRAEDGRHLRWLAAQIGDDLVDAAIVTTGQVAYRRPDGIAVIPAMLLGP